MPRPPSNNATGEAPSYAASYADVEPEQLVRVGFVFRPHGVHGEIKVDPEDTDDPTRYETWEQVFVGANNQAVTRHSITGVRYQETKRGVTVILSLEGIDDRDDAEAVAKMAVFVRQDDLDLDEDEVFVHDLIGIDVLVVRQSSGEEALIPAVDDFVRAFDLDAGRVVIRPIDGLLS